MNISPHSCRKGVAPVIATLLMIAVAVAMSVIIFMWSQGFLSQTSSATGGQQGSQNQAAQSSISIELATFVTGTGSTNAGTLTCAGINDGVPKVTLVVRNVGAVAVNLGSLTISGITSNSGFKGSVTIPSVGVAGTSAASTPAWSALISSVSDGSWRYSTGATSGTLGSLVSVNKGGSVSVTVCQVGASATLTQIVSGDVINLKQTTNVGTFAQAQFTVP